MPSLPKDSLFDVIAGSEVTRDTESFREAVLVYQNVGCPEEESEVPGSQSQDVTTSELTSASSIESDQSTSILRSIAQVEEESEVPGSQSQDVTTSGPASASSRKLDQSTPILGSIGQVLPRIREDIEPNEPTRPSEPSIKKLPRYENLENLELSNEAISSSELSRVRASTSSREPPILESIGHVEEESELPGSQFQDVTTSGPASGSSRETDQSTPILDSIGQIDQEPNGPTRPSEPPAENLPRYDNLENLESFRVIRQLVPVYQYVDCRAEEPVRFRPQPEEIPVETPCLDFSVNFVLDYWKIILIGLLILGVIIFLIIFFTASKHSSVAPTFGTVTTTVTESMQSTISTTSSITSVAAKLTSPPVDDCTPKTDTTFLFAYSNDLSPSVVEKGRDLILQYIQTSKIVSFANIRFDTTTDDLIYFHSSKEEFQKSVTNNLPDSKLSFPSTNTGSNVLNVLRKFLANQESPLCGAIVYILMKRWPNTQDVSELISQLRQRHIFVYTVSDTSQSGGENQSLICEVTHGTNGFCDFQSTGYMKDDMYQSLQCISNTFQIVSQSYEVTGKGVIRVPSFVRPYQNNGLEPMALVITYQNHKRDSNLKAVGYTIFDDKNENVWMNSLKYWDGNVFLDHPVLQNNVTYQIVINYEYGDVREENIEVRVYSSSAVDSWLPFSCYAHPC